ncbi:MAG: PEGA domain-containing protein, partial [Chitinivibrionales bacterium]|nr:PEGA domain-containing protein [Chitinivibrionales bacterium]
KKLLNSYIQGLCTPSEHQRVTAHLRVCRVCTAELSELREVIETLGRAFPVPPKSDCAWRHIHDRVMDDLETPRQPWYRRVWETAHGTVTELPTTIWARRSLRYAYIGVPVMLLLVTILLFVAPGVRPVGAPTVEHRTPATPESVLLSADVLRAQGAVRYYAKSYGEEREQRASAGVLEETSRITTAEGATVYVGLGPGTGVVVAENSDLCLRSLHDDSVCLYLDKGTVLARVAKRKPGQVFRVETPDGACKVVGTRFAVQVYPGGSGKDGHAVFAVQKGAIDVFLTSGEQKRVRVANGERIRVAQDGTVRHDDAEFDSQAFAALDTLARIAALPAGDTPAGNGRLQVVSEPAGAAVHVDGAFWGVTPLLSLAQPGTHLVTVTKPGYEKWRRRITNPKTGTYHLSVTLDANPPPRPKKTAKKPIRPRVAADPVDVSLLKTGQAKKRRGDRDQALQAFKMIIELDSTSENVRLEALEGAYKLCIADSNSQEALTYINALVAEGRDDERAQRALLARARLKANCIEDISGAIKDYMRYLLDYPHGRYFDEAARGFAEAVHRVGNGWRARRAYQRCLAVFQRSDEGLRILSTLARVWEVDYDECALALPCYAIIVQEYAETPEMEHALFGYGECLHRTGRPDKAIEAFELYSQKFPDGSQIAEVNDRLAGPQPGTEGSEPLSK